MELSVQNFSRICRACLCESSNMKSLFTKLENNERSLLDLFSLAANLGAEIDDGLPKQICGECEVVLYKSEEFRNRCLASDAILKKIYETSTYGQYFDAINPESYRKDDKSSLFSDKISEFELENVEKRVSAEFSYLEPEDRQKLNTMFDSVKKETIFESDQDFVNEYDSSEPLVKPIELKDETQSALPQLSTKKLQWKKKETPKNKDYSYITYEFSCNTCSINFKDLVSWENHIQTHSTTKNQKENSDSGSYQCSLCFRRCKTKKTLSKHMKLHERTDNIKYSCDKCKREFKYKSFLESHVISVHMHRDFTCHLCTEKFDSKDSLEAHIDSHKEKKKHVCGICSKAFIMLCTLRDHMRKHTGEKPFLCSTCGKGFSQKTNLAQHTRRHLGVKPFKCGICSKGFVSKGELDAHTRKHSGAHPFVCDDCGNGFTTSSALVKHRRIHTGERPYACDLCPMRFAASGTLKNHRRTHTGERPFQCSLCEKAFVQKTDMISHIRCHTGERPYVCSHCGQAFRKTAALKTHLKMHGKEMGEMIPGVCC